MNYQKNEDIYIKQSNSEIILFIHGIFASHVQFHTLIKCLKEKGYSIYAIALKGHGQSYKAFKDITAHDWINQVNHRIDQLTNQYNKVYIIAHSLGSLLTINSEHVNKVSKVVLLSPAIKPKITFRSINLALRINTKTNNYYLNQSKKINGIEFNRFYQKIFAIKPLLELHKIIKITKKHLESFDNDTIIVISKNDETLRLSSAQYVYDRIKSQYKDLIILNKSYHTILDKDEESKLYNRIYEFIKKNN